MRTIFLTVRERSDTLREVIGSPRVLNLAFHCALSVRIGRSCVCLQRFRTTDQICAWRQAKIKRKAKTGAYIVVENLFVY